MFKFLSLLFSSLFCVTLSEICTFNLCAYPNEIIREQKDYEIKSVIPVTQSVFGSGTAIVTDVEIFVNISDYINTRYLIASVYHANVIPKPKLKLWDMWDVPSVDKNTVYWGPDNITTTWDYWNGSRTVIFTSRQEVQSKIGGANSYWSDNGEYKPYRQFYNCDGCTYRSYYGNFSDTFHGINAYGNWTFKLTNGRERRGENGTFDKWCISKLCVSVTPGPTQSPITPAPTISCNFAEFNIQPKNDIKPPAEDHYSNFAMSTSKCQSFKFTTFENNEVKNSLKFTCVNGDLYYQLFEDLDCNAELTAEALTLTVGDSINLYNNEIKFVVTDYYCNGNDDCATVDSVGGKNCTWKNGNLYYNVTAPMYHCIDSTTTYTFFGLGVTKKGSVFTSCCQQDESLILSGSNDFECSEEIYGNNSVRIPSQYNGQCFKTKWDGVPSDNYRYTFFGIMNTSTEYASSVILDWECDSNYYIDCEARNISFLPAQALPPFCDNECTDTLNSGDGYPDNPGSTDDPSKSPSRSPLASGESFDPSKSPTRSPLAAGESHSPTISPTKRPNAGSNNGGSNSNSNAAVIVGAILGVVLLIVLVIGFYFCIKKTSMEKELNHYKQMKDNQSPSQNIQLDTQNSVVGKINPNNPVVMKPISNIRRDNDEDLFMEGPGTKGNYNPGGTKM